METVPLQVIGGYPEVKLPNIGQKVKTDGIYPERIKQDGILQNSSLYTVGQMGFFYTAKPRYKRSDTVYLDNGVLNASYGLRSNSNGANGSGVKTVYFCAGNGNTTGSYGIRPWGGRLILPLHNLSVALKNNIINIERTIYNVKKEATLLDSLFQTVQQSTINRMSR